MKRIYALKTPLAALGLLVLVALIGGAWLLSRHSESRPGFNATPLRHGDVVATISATGTIEPVEVVDVGAQVAGRISFLGNDVNTNTVDYGSLVEQGALLARIDDSVYAAELSVAKAGELSAGANLEQMSAKLEQAAAEWKRSQELFSTKLVSQADFDSAKANYQVAKANVSVANSAVAQAKADLEKAQRNLDFCTIRSPVSGVIIDRRVNIGQTVVASLNAPSLFLIARDLTKMQIWASVNEADVGRIKPRSPVLFTVDAYPGREFQGVVGKVRLNATMTQNVVLYTVEINIDNPDKQLLPYLTANVRFILARETHMLLAPNAALRWAPSSVEQVAPDCRQAYLADTSVEKAAAKAAHKTLWLKEGDWVRPVAVSTGTTDGAQTVVAAEGLLEGQCVVLGEAAPSSSSDVKNPFLPKLLRR